MRNVKSGHSKPIICLDAGHAGKYNRSPAVPEYYESEMNWKLHNYLATELESYGIQVKKTRAEQGKDLSLYNRGAASKNCDLFLSIHSNAVGSNVDESVDYVRLYHLVDDKSTSVDDQSKEVAKLLLPAIVDTMQPKQGGHITTRKSTKDSNGDGVLNDNYYGVLNGARQVGTAGLILEHSFHTNTKMTLWLLEDANLRKLAKAEAKVLAEYFGMIKTKEEPKTEEQPKVEDKTEKVSTYTLTLPLLRKSAEGDHVKAVQNLLLAHNIKLPRYGADGDFGGETEAGVIAFQKAVGIDDDGVVGRDTMSKLLGL